MNDQNLVDERAYLGVIGCLLQRSTLVDSQDYPLVREDFNSNDFYEILFIAIHNIYVKGAEKIDEFTIDSYLSSRDVQYKIFKDNNGLEYLSTAREIADLSNYEYFYHKLKKFSLLRYYESKGLNTKPIYDSTVTDPSQKEIEQKKLEDLTEQDIIDSVENILVIQPRTNFCSNILTDEQQAGANLQSLIDKYLEKPDYGYPLASIGLSTLSRGARKKTLYLRSAGTGTGKTRMALMDACYISVPYVYDIEKKRYIHTGNCIPTLFIGVEGSLEEFKRIILATVSKVSTDHILKGKYDPGELQRVRQAAEYIEQAPLYLVYCDDYSITDVEGIIKKYVLTYQIEVCMFDYLQSSLRLMSEIRSKGASGLQEYQMLRIFATRLKALAESQEICIISATQLNDTVNERKYKDQACLEGSKSIANKIDLGVICTRPTPVEKAKLEKIIHHQIGCPEINLLTWAYKIRDGEYSRIIICSHIDLSCMTIKDCFFTDYDFNLIEVELDDIQLIEEVVAEHSAPIDEQIEEEIESEETTRSFNW